MVLYEPSVKQPEFKIEMHHIDSGILYWDSQDCLVKVKGHLVDEKKHVRMVDWTAAEVSIGIMGLMF
jgi:hypothetical protein